MLPTMFLSSPRSRRNSTRMPDSSVATRDSYGAELMTMSLFPFCTLSLPAGDEFGRQLLGREPVGGKRSPQDRPRGVERPGAFPGSMDDCNEEALSVHQEIGDQGFQVDLGSAPLLLHGHREFAGGAKGLPRLLPPIRGALLRQPAGQDREDGVAAGQGESGDPRRPRRHLPGLPDGNPAGEEGREFFPDFSRRNGETELRLHEFREAFRAEGEGRQKAQTGGGVEPLAVGNGETGPPQGAPPEGLDLQPAQIPCRAFLGVPYANDVTKNPVAAGFRVRRLRAGLPLLLTTPTRGGRGVGPAGGACAARRADVRAAVGRRLSRTHFLPLGQQERPVDSGVHHAPGERIGRVPLTAVPRGVDPGLTESLTPRIPTKLLGPRIEPPAPAGGGKDRRAEAGVSARQGTFQLRNLRRVELDLDVPVPPDRRPDDPHAFFRLLASDLTLPLEGGMRLGNEGRYACRHDVPPPVPACYRGHLPGQFPDRSHVVRRLPGEPHH